MSAIANGMAIGNHALSQARKNNKIQSEVDISPGNKGSLKFFKQQLLAKRRRSNQTTSKCLKLIQSVFNLWRSTNRMSHI
ncbi:MAG: hypothetical protein HC769_24705 [Cyanobacteria bacterium CRU_2_1]|nr:hypothetical protein [Cyanobacteria bacterium CRU_2_1]